MYFGNIIYDSLSWICTDSFCCGIYWNCLSGIAFIVLFNLIDKPDSLDRLLYYLSGHSTNMWLTHMFFYMIYFKSLVFMPKYSVLIFIWLVILCLILSYLIKLIYSNIIKKINF